MPDTGENREIRQRGNAKEAEIASETKKMSQKSKEKERQDTRQKPPYIKEEKSA